MEVRFAYATNWARYLWHRHADRKGRRGAALSTPDELWNLTFRRSETNGATASQSVPFEDQRRLLSRAQLQDIAIERVLDPSPPRSNAYLLTLATGTGKTFIAFQIAWKLFHSRWNLSREPSRRPRILFLADRNILADQAYKRLLRLSRRCAGADRPEDIRKKGRVPKNGSLSSRSFRLHERPAEGGQPRPNFGEYPPDFFDSSSSTSAIARAPRRKQLARHLEYFAPAVQLGLTATPKRKGQHRTPTRISASGVRLLAQGRHQ